MGDGTGIEWTESTWNPVTGCDKVSAGCDNCYAETIAHRFDGTPAYPNGFAVTLRPDRLVQPLRWQRPRAIFVNSMSDLFHSTVPDQYIARVFAVMAMAPRHTFQVLTKRPGRMRSLLTSPAFAEAVTQALRDVLDLYTVRVPAEDYDAATAWAGSRERADEYVAPLPNVWLGVSAEDQRWLNVRVPLLVQTPAAVRFVSAEPLLGPISLRWAAWQPWSRGEWTDEYDGARMLDWVIVGGESGHGARPMHPEWARTLRDECAEAGVSYLFKQWGAWTEVDPADGRRGDRWVLPDTGGTQEWTPDSAGAAPGRWHEHGDVLMRRTSKADAGRTLDGVVHDGYPTAQQVLT